MKILFIADGRSPIALNWIAYFTDSGHEVHLASTFACEPDLSFASVHPAPVALSELKESHSGKSDGNRGVSTGGGVGAGLRTSVRHWIGPLTLPSAAKRLKELIDRLNPELVHAMRIPYEGMLAAQALRSTTGIPLIISVWGNDFTLHASSTPWMSKYTRRALQRADGLHVDCQRDQHLATTWGYSKTKPTVVLPGNGGIRLDEFYPPKTRSGVEGETIINPRGFRAYIRNDTFFQAVRQVLDESPRLKFVCPAMAEEPEALAWVKRLELSKAVELLPKVSRKQMGDLFRRAIITVSPSIHDGTPNSLLEGMACGCFPIAGDLESVREWITSEVNGMLIDPTDPATLTKAILSAIDRPEFRRQAGEYNLRLVTERAEYFHVMQKAEQFYAEVTH
jgi:glycosyltransferase involved in cell wall biosynthesis